MADHQSKRPSAPAHISYPAGIKPENLLALSPANAGRFACQPAYHRPLEGVYALEVLDPHILQPQICSSPYDGIIIAYCEDLRPPVGAIALLTIEGEMQLARCVGEGEFVDMADGTAISPSGAVIQVRGTVIEQTTFLRNAVPESGFDNDTISKDADIVAATPKRSRVKGGRNLRVLAPPPPIFDWYENEVQRSLTKLYRCDRTHRYRIAELIQDLNDSPLFWKLMASYQNALDSTPNDSQRQHHALEALLARMYLAGTAHPHELLDQFENDSDMEEPHKRGAAA